MNRHPKSSALSARFVWMPSVGSTNDELMALARGPSGASLPEFTVVATDDQRAGRGRRDRSWVCPPGTALAASVLVTPRTGDNLEIPTQMWGWFPLLAGLAMTNALRQFVPSNRHVTVKWPNDVLIDSYKVCGILSEVVVSPDDRRHVVIGAGVNLTLDEARLPTPRATSLSLMGSTVTDSDSVLSAYLGQLRSEMSAFASASGDVISSGLHARVVDACHTLHERVRVLLPDGTTLHGLAEDIDREGHLLIRLDSPNSRAGETVAVSAGDVTHVRVDE